MRSRTLALLVGSGAFLALALWIARPPASLANGDKHDDDKGGHAHVPAPLEYADAHVPLGVWTDPAMITRGKEIYTTRCAVCHGDAGDGKGPAGVVLPLKPSDFRDKAGVGEMRDNYWFWRVSEGGQVEPFRSKGSAMPPWKGELSVQDRWAVMAYQHTFSGHDGPHVPREHPESLAMGRDIYAMACVGCHGVEGRGDGSVGPTLSPRRAPQPRDFTTAEFKFRSTPSGQLPTTADLFRTLTEGVRSGGGAMTFGLYGHRIMPSFRHMPEEQRLEVIEYVKSLNPAFRERREISIVSIPAPPPVTSERVARGRKLYADAECQACHGERGRGDGPSAPTLKDNRELPIAATDLTRPERFKGGSRPEDVYRTLMTGLSGTPMPSYGDSLEPDQSWDLVYYVLSLSRDGWRRAGGGPIERWASAREMAMMRIVVAAVMAMLILADVAAADEAPISGSVKAVDTANQTVTLEVTGRGKTRQVVVHLKPGARVVKFVRASEPGKAGFVEQQLPLADVKAGWVVSVETKHEGDKEVAELVKVVLER